MHGPGVLTRDVTFKINGHGEICIHVAKKEEFGGRELSQSFVSQPVTRESTRHINHMQTYPAEGCLAYMYYRYEFNDFILSGPQETDDWFP